MLVFDYKIVQIDYFLDEMLSYEIPLFIDNLIYVDKGGWEQTRLIVYSIGSLFAKKKVSLTEFLKLPWDKDIELEKTTEISNDEIIDLKKKSEEMLKKITM